VGGVPASSLRATTELLSLRRHDAQTRAEFSRRISKSKISEVK
jgi:hypothetical protein